jgi:hypothetical protein
MNDKMISTVILSLVVTIAFLNGTFLLPSKRKVSAQESRGWRVWIRTEPCAGRFDWLSVAKERGGAGTGKGMGTYVLYDAYLPLPSGLKPCLESEPFGCTFAEATALMEALRGHPRFFDFCCKEYSVWENTQTRKRTVVLGKFGNPGLGWRFVKGDLCCEQAEELAGIPGACSGTQSRLGCFKDSNNPFDLDGHLERSANNTPQRCIEICRQKGFAYAGVQYGQSCLCGNSYGKQGLANNCNMPCTGDPKQICGGINSNIVYATGAGQGGVRGPGGRTGSSGGSDGTDTGQAVAGRWILQSATVTPPTPPQGWNYNPQSSSAQYTVYNGDKANFQWTPPPQQIDGNGFTVSLSVQANPIPRSRLAALIGVSGSGLTSSTAGGEPNAYAIGENGSSASAQKSVTFKPASGASELEVKVGMMWGAATFTYKYRRAQ